MGRGWASTESRVQISAHPGINYIASGKLFNQRSFLHHGIVVERLKKEQANIKQWTQIGSLVGTFY